MRDSKFKAFTSERLVHLPEYSSLPRSFYERDTIQVAPDLVGKYLVRRTVDDGISVARLVEVEAYLGEHDPAAHAAAGKTERTAVLYGEPGHAYVFRIRGHHCLNAVAEEKGSPGCVLIRAAEPVTGQDIMRKRRSVTKPDVTDRELTNGPGKLCQALGIDMSLYGADLVADSSPLRICESREREHDDFEIEVSERIGISQAQDWQMRFVMRGNKYVSG